MTAAQQQKVLAMLAALDPDGSRYTLLVLEHEYERVQRARRPMLKLVQANNDSPEVRYERAHHG